MNLNQDDHTTMFANYHNNTEVKIIHDTWISGRCVSSINIYINIGQAKKLIEYLQEAIRLAEAK